jgi:hypothetical protein
MGSIVDPVPEGISKAVPGAETRFVFIQTMRGTNPGHADSSRVILVYVLLTFLVESESRNLNLGTAQHPPHVG